MIEDHYPTSVFFTREEPGDKILNVLLNGTLYRLHLNQDQADRIAIEAPRVAIQERNN